MKKLFLIFGIFTSSILMCQDLTSDLKEDKFVMKNEFNIIHIDSCEILISNWNTGEISRFEIIGNFGVYKSVFRMVSDKKQKKPVNQVYKMFYITEVVTHSVAATTHQVLLQFVNDKGGVISYFCNKDNY